jgi:hypothetical protein
MRQQTKEPEEYLGTELLLMKECYEYNNALQWSNKHQDRYTHLAVTLQNKILQFKDLLPYLKERSARPIDGLTRGEYSSLHEKPQEFCL